MRVGILFLEAVSMLLDFCEICESGGLRRFLPLVHIFHFCIYMARFVSHSQFSRFEQFYYRFSFFIYFTLHVAILMTFIKCVLNKNLILHIFKSFAVFYSSDEGYTVQQIYTKYAQKCCGQMKSVSDGNEFNFAHFISCKGVS